MLVYIIFEKCVRRSPRVGLLNSLKPTVGTFTEERIEPALWFKVLMLDSILIDCERRKVFVNYDRTGLPLEVNDCQYENVIDVFKEKEQLFEDSLVYDFDPTVDELFETSVSVFKNLRVEVFDKQGNAETFENLLKILHVFILPEIRLQDKHKDAVVEALKMIEEDHEKVEDLIQKKDKTKRNTENSLSEQRQTFLLSGNFSSSKYVSSLGEDFLMLFLQHLEKDIRKQNEALINYDCHVRSLRQSTSKDDGELLASYRSERSEVNSAIERSIVAREEIKNVISRKHVKKKFKKNKQGIADFHELYVEVTHRLENIDAEIKKLIMAKIKLSGIREAALLTIREIEKDGESYGFNRKKGSFEMEADLFDPNKKPEEWATMTERVKTYLQVKQLGFRTRFETFCSRIKLKCQQLYDESKMFGAAPSSPNYDMNGECLPFRNAFTLSRSRGYTVRWSTGSISRHKCELICQEVIDHVSKVALDLAIELMGTDKPIPRSYHNKLYVCYEEHVSSELLPTLCELYEKSYMEQCDGLAEWLCQYSYSEIGFEEKMISGLCQVGTNSQKGAPIQSSDETVVKVPIDSSGDSSEDTIDSIDLTQLHIDDLYSKINMQSDGLPQSFAGALDVMEYANFADAPDDICVGRKTVGSKASTSSEDEGANGGINLPTYEETVRKKDVAESDPPPYSTLSPEQGKFYEAFEQFIELVKEEESICTLFSKLRHMTHINKYIEKQITKLREQSGVYSVTCTDDILDVIILLLCRLDREWLLKLYAHLNLMIHLSPSFMQGNAHDYSLVNFSVAYQHLFEKQVIHRSSYDPMKT